MLERHHHVGVERVCSGIGIPNIYDYLRDVEQIPENSDIARSIDSAVDRTPAITNAAFDKKNPSPLCGATIDTFVSILANEAGNLALKVMATNGVYLGGGIVLNLPRAYVAARFLEGFKPKDRFTELMERIPVHLILNRAALVGSAAYGLRSFNVDLS